MFIEADTPYNGRRLVRQAKSPLFVRVKEYPVALCRRDECEGVSAMRVWASTSIQPRHAHKMREEPETYTERTQQTERGKVPQGGVGRLVG